MQRNCSEARLKQLLAYPEHHFGEPASERWLALCSSLIKYQARSRNFGIGKERKWELVSAIQKAIRRADKTTALRLISGIANMPDEYPYFLRRMCVIACEDIGPADDNLVRFTIACAVFSVKDRPQENHRLLCFLAERMCDLPLRSRIYCSAAVISHAADQGLMPRLSTDDKLIVQAISHHKDTVRMANTGVHSWQQKQNWRAAGLLKFVGISLPWEMKVRDEPVAACRRIFDLPTFCYDQYTRIGLEVLRRIVKGVHGAEAIRDFFQRNRVKDPHKVLGEALFTVEGGREKRELVYPALSSLEQRIFARQFGLQFDDWLRLCDLTREALENGLINKLREETLSRQYAQKNLPLVC